MAKKESIKAKKTKKSKLEHVYDKKPLIEFIVALLSIPSIILLLILNFNSIKNLDNPKPTPTPDSTSNNFIKGTTGSGSNYYAAPVGIRHMLVPTAQPDCDKSLGPVSITSPGEGDTVIDNPVEIDISYDNSKYCGAAWSYSINGGTWSSYDDRSVALYNLPDGQITFDLRVKSIASSDETTLTRHFTYNGSTSAPIPTNASSSAH